MTDEVEPHVSPEMRAKIDAIRAQYRNKRRYLAECKADVTAHMEGTIENWPANIQDGIYAALARTSLGSKYEIKISYCDRNWDKDQPDGSPQYFVHVIATAEVELTS